jgi:hypothetical protein
MTSETYEFLRKIASGEGINRWSYPDKLIYNVIPSNNPNTTKIVIAFDDDNDFLDVLGVEDETDKWIWGRYMGRGYGGDEVDTERYSYDWEEGYIIGSFNEEQKEKVREILKITNPKLTLTNDNDSEVAKYLGVTFGNEVNDIKYEYSYEYAKCEERAISNVLEKETKNPFIRFGIVEKQHAYKFETTVNILLTLYGVLKAKDEDLKGLLKKLIEKYPPNSGRSNWSDLEYNGLCEDLDKTSLNNSYDSNLDEMLELAEESISENPNFVEYNEIVTKVNELGGFDDWIGIPKGGRVKFHDIDRDTNKLRFIYSKEGEWRGEMRSVDNLEDLNTMLYNPELFESIRRNVKKLL